MFKKLWEWTCLVMGVTPPGEPKPVDKWAEVRSKHEAWQKEQAGRREAAEDAAEPGRGDAAGRADHQA